MAWPLRGGTHCTPRLCTTYFDYVFVVASQPRIQDQYGSSAAALDVSTTDMYGLVAVLNKHEEYGRLCASCAKLCTPCNATTTTHYSKV